MEDNKTNKENERQVLPPLLGDLAPVVKTAGDKVLRIIPIKNSVLFPHNVLPLTPSNDLKLESMENILRAGGNIHVGIVTQKADGKLYSVGTEARVVKVLRFPDTTYGAVLQGIRRFRIKKFLDTTKSKAEVDFLPEDEFFPETIESAALGKGLKQLVQRAITLSPNIPSEAGLFVESVSDLNYLCDLIIPYFSIDFKEKQALLEVENFHQRLRIVHDHLVREVEILEVAKKLQNDVRSEVGKTQRRYYLREQLRLLQGELSEIDGNKSESTDPQSLKERIEKSAMTKETKDAALREVERMNVMQPGSPEYMVSHTYVSWLLDVPWGVYTQAEVNLKKARKVLDDDHYSLEKIKKRILEYLAVYSLKKDLKAPILLFSGPPGVGKTSLGKSVAKALGRKFVRISLGGVRDEAEIRGHRRTYIGSMPGKLVDALKKAGSMDPVILLDEVDKIAMDGRSDPSSALLEVLDPEQNHTFTDHYLNTPVDLSRVLFIATANTLHSIPGPLRDRMELIELSGYTADEKTQIAFKHLIPQVEDENGLKGVTSLEFSQSSLKNLIHSYTREAGVRQLKRELATVARKVATEIVTEKTRKKKSHAMNDKLVQKYLGQPQFSETKRPKCLPFGVSTGLAYTPVGGDVLFIESVLSAKGSGKTSLTGQLGDVMKESVQTALAYISANVKICGVEELELSKRDLHIHFPAGAIKKDGPSAGVAVFSALVGLFAGKSIPSDVAMTGEISLRGEVMPVGGVKEKLLAAHRYGIKHVLIPTENKKDLEDLPKEVLKEMKVTTVSTLPQVLKLIFAAKTK